jgi:hypothetical protein
MRDGAVCLRVIADPIAKVELPVEECSDGRCDGAVSGCDMLRRGVPSVLARRKDRD